MPEGRQPIRFGVFEVNLDTGELRRAGLKVRLQEQPFQVLAALLEKPGETVTKEELQERIWKGDTFVDFDRSLATAVNKVRQALGDSATRPRFVETVAKRGYRFIGGFGDQGAAPATEQLPPGSVVVARRKFLGLQLLAAALAIIALASVFFGGRTAPDSEKLLRRFSMSPEGLTAAAISPDGRHIAYGAVDEDGQHRLHVYTFSTEASRSLAGTGGLLHPTLGSPSTFSWAPDSRALAFAVGDELKTVPLDGGAPSTVCRLPQRIMVGASWSPDGEQIVFASREGIYTAAARGGEAQLVVERDAGEFWIHPRFLPSVSGARVIVFSGGDSVNRQTLVVLNLETGERRELGYGHAPVYAPSGHLIFARGPADETDLWAARFSLDELRLTSEPFRVADSGHGPTVSADGTLVYKEDLSTLSRVLVWRDRAGAFLGAASRPQEGLREAALSPDGTAAAVTAGPIRAPDIWIHDLERSGVTRLTFSDPGGFFATWSPSGHEIIHSTLGAFGMMRRRSDGTGEAVKISERRGFADWSSDGQRVVFSDVAPESKRRGDLYYIEFGEDGTASDPVAFLATDALEIAPQLSPNDRFVAYVSDESGLGEVYVRQFPSGTGRWQVSAKGGEAPRWNPDGSELFFVEGRSALVAVPTSIDSNFSFGNPERLFESENLVRGGGPPQYDVAPDGRRFLLSEPAGKGESSARIRIVENWYEEFRARAQ